MKNSLAAKVFFWVLCALALCSFFIYGTVMVIIPKQYTFLENTRTSQAFYQLAAELEGMDRAAAKDRIYNFCIQNHAAAILAAGEETISFGDSAGIENAESTSSISALLQLSDLSESSMLTVISAAPAAGEVTRAFLKTLPLVLVLIFLISSFSAWLCSRVIARPIRKLSSVSKRMAGLDLTWRCDVTSTDELGVLAESLNSLSQQLAQAMGELEEANAQLKADIAASHALEKQRRDFFAAASHELKTPITILKGQLESMALGIGDYKNHGKYLPQALSAVESIEQLIQEMLAVSKMESGVPASSFAEEAAAPILRSSIADIAPLAAEKQTAIEAELDEAVRIRVNRALFQKAVSNILSNAVRYSPPGQRVTVTLTADAITVENTGAAIAEADLPLLFTPFYRVDKSRNRKSGGSGLGLYIVKTILDLHGFGFKIENVPGAVRFTVNMNQN